MRVPGIRYLGLHGWDNESDTRLQEMPRNACCAPSFGSKRSVAAGPGVWIEDKDQILAVHFAQCGVKSARANECRRPRAPRKVTVSICALHPAEKSGKSIPRELEDKGAAVRRELAALCCDATPIYAGDDLGDEPAFAALRQGITIYVGRVRRTKARFHLADSGEVHSFLNRLRTGFA